MISLNPFRKIVKIAEETPAPAPEPVYGYVYRTYSAGDFHVLQFIEVRQNKYGESVLCELYSIGGGSRFEKWIAVDELVYTRLFQFEIDAINEAMAV